jgi:hypothetical protein
MFRASSAHPQEVNDVNCVCMQPLVSSFFAGLVQSLEAIAQDGHLQRRTILVAAYIHNLHH